MGGSGAVIDSEFYDNYRNSHFVSLPPDLVMISEELCPVLIAHARPDTDIVEKALAATSINAPCAMEVESLEEHIDYIDQLNAANYIRAKRFGGEGWLRQFPNLCCMLSSESILLNLYMQEYANAAIFYSNAYGHAYIGLPFIMQGKEGVIISDPTAEQTLLCRRPSTEVITLWGRDWSYITNWRDGADLYPDRICSIDTLRKLHANADGRGRLPVFDDALREGVKEYFAAAYANPVPPGKPLKIQLPK